MSTRKVKCMPKVVSRAIASQSYCKGMTVGLNEDTLGGVLKCGFAQYLAIEITRGNKDNSTVARYLPWLYNAPSALQQG
jgi:hypothetical protein